MRDQREEKIMKDGNGMMAKDKISVIVPCYNEAESIELFLEKTEAVLQGIGEADYEILFIDDGSSDGTLQLLEKVCAEKEHCRYFSFSRNFGKEAAMYCGLSEALGDYCVIMDADLQHPPELLPLMYEAVSREGYDCCGGKRQGREGDGVLRSMCSRLFYRIGKALTHLDMGDGCGDFRMMNRTMVSAILRMKEYNRYMKGIFSFVGFQTKWIPYPNAQRVRGSSKWNFKSLWSYAMEGIFSFSAAPLKLAGVGGGMLMTAGLLLFAGRLLGFWPDVDMILILLLLLSGLQMLFLHIMGIYLAKDCMENKGRPIYIVRRRG